MAEKKKVGRPKAKLDLPKDWQLEVLDLYEQGASDVEVKALIYQTRGSFSNDLWERWMKEEPEFSETIKIGKMLSEAWWCKAGRTKLGDREFSYTGWYMNMKNRFGWSDKQQIDHSGSIEGEKQVIILPSNNRDLETEDD
jgi:hypothetical protein